MIWDTVELFSFDVMDNSERAIKTGLLRLARLLFYSRSSSSRGSSSPVSDWVMSERGDGTIFFMTKYEKQMTA